MRPVPWRFSRMSHPRSVSPWNDGPEVLVSRSERLVPRRPEIPGQVPVSSEMEPAASRGGRLRRGA